MKIRKYGFNINNYKNKLSRSPLNPKVLASDLHIDVNKSFKKELARKLIHLSSLWIPALIYFVQPSISIIVFSAIFVGDVILEYGNYKKWRWARRTFGLLFYRTLRNKELKRSQLQLSGGAYVMLAAIACTLLFPANVAVVALSIMLISDTCAALFGKAYGSRRLYKNKSIEGTAAFFVSALLIMVICNFILPVTYASILAAFVATFAEMYEDKIEIDDNLSIPLFVGAVLSLLG
ncbi:MAG: diacylglycerol/polyprenol kinase family protein [Alphaproteobacteria bacterium]|jgi:dolichol kinase|uniref:Phosphatidate cytidylyltransferase n=1 Tax=Candidatus Scatocola faecipullorum TaxID=2840917 RepID=A0A9D1M2T9_9PROT|nr:MAG: phosphatidate cytidylyltransferase [Azospirillum sp.]CDB40703.1 phosphatidate cytidylyltransferase [Azospirillum sp. CAG:260]HIU52539.1 phosphatidate cytidylyltransferase [Candidatus Scatocola faecipullorum]